ncbi:MAG: DUF1028 domain-containing protein [Candidatus Odinarchaeia archaeon]
MTYSIVALDKHTQTLGVATATWNFDVWKRVPHIKNGVGAIVTQGFTEVAYGVNGLKLLEQGYTPQEALENMLKSDPEKELRQIAIIDIHGRKTAFTGRETPKYKGHIIGGNYIVAGNLLASPKVVEKMAEAFEAGGEFAEKILSALKAGGEAGGDARGERSAVLIIAPKTGKNIIFKINKEHNPVKYLSEIFSRKR